MRIITGSARGVALKTLEGERTRPTAEKVKEAIFSALQFDLEGRAFLDLFAGSGQMGLEALSRGAARAVFIDESRDAMERVIAADMAKHGTLFVLESEEDIFADAPLDDGRFELLKAKKYGRTYVHILRYLKEDAE